jgi:hypothetical protein
LIPSPYWSTKVVIEDVTVFAVNGREDRTSPAFGADDGRRQVVTREPTGVSAFEGVNLDLAADGATEKEQ